MYLYIGFNVNYNVVRDQIHSPAPGGTFSFSFGDDISIDLSPKADSVDISNALRTINKDLSVKINIIIVFFSFFLTNLFTLYRWMSLELEGFSMDLYGR